MTQPKSFIHVSPLELSLEHHVSQLLILLSNCSLFRYYIVFRKDFGPGPSHFLDPMTTRHGRDGTPHYSLFSRNKALEPFKTPAPGNYAPEKYPNPYSVRSPTYSMGARTKYRRSKFQTMNYKIFYKQYCCS